MPGSAFGSVVKCLPLGQGTVLGSWIESYMGFPASKTPAPPSPFPLLGLSCSLSPSNKSIKSKKKKRNYCLLEALFDPLKPGLYPSIFVLAHRAPMWSKPVTMCWGL